MPETTPTDTQLEVLRTDIQSALPAFLSDLERLVNTDCGSYTKAGVDEVGEFVATRMRELGAAVEVRSHATYGDTVIGTWDAPGGGASPNDAGPNALLIGHMDTVFDPG